MSCHAQSLACHLLSYFIGINKEECESVGIVLGLIPAFNSSTGVNSIPPETRGLCRRLLPQLTRLAAQHNSMYSVQKPYHMMNLSTVLETIIRPLVSSLSSYERSELHSTISAACNFLQSDLTNIRMIVSKWIQVNPDGFSTDSGYYLGCWEYTVKPVARPTARIVVPPSKPSQRLPSRTHTLRRPSTFTIRRTASTESTQSQRSKIANIAGVMKLVKPLGGHTRSHSESSNPNPSLGSKFDNDERDARFYSFYYAPSNRKQTFP